ncbi:hypothetical protein RESH_03367 [Rhodopirellula europaea SH398]|uniref:Uncharacterized protein n=1 Tax=Rhodopirellula europaea SH398 TaxID=1263868 RepID=M5S3C3_9BACT|nr:hypothetical protein RESH_03367 [Rhodopirellula europaea SH398]
MLIWSLLPAICMGNAKLVAVRLKQLERFFWFSDFWHPGCISTNPDANASDGGIQIGTGVNVVPSLLKAPFQEESQC